MARYLTRNRLRRIYKWGGLPVSHDRKLKTDEYDSLHISLEDLPRTTVITNGQYILIEGVDDDHPYVAKVTKLIENDKKKKALVQWFARVGEVPPNKLKLLGREPHPQEIFYYEGPTCEDEIDVESILNTVQVKFIPADASFPDVDRQEVLYVKLSWNTKVFKAVTPEQIETAAAAAAPRLVPTPGRLRPALPPSPPCSPALAATPRSRAPSRRALPTPDPMVMNRAAAAGGHGVRGTASAGKMVAAAAEAESMHSASKISASKCLSGKRRSCVARTPGVRKKLELSSPRKSLMDGDEGLCQLLDQDLDQDVLMVQRSATTLTRLMSLPGGLTPARKTSRSAGSWGSQSMKPVLSYTSLGGDSSPETALQDSDRELCGVASLEDEVFDMGLKLTPRRQATPRRNHATRGQKASTPSRRAERAAKEHSLGVLAEENENSPMEPAAPTPRTSRRKSAQLVSSRIRKQLSLLDDVHSDGDDSDEFLPSVKELRSSSDEEEEEEPPQEEEEEEEEEFCARLDSDDEIVAKKSKRGAAVVPPRTPRSARKSQASMRTPRKTPVKKATPTTPRTPRHATPSIPSRSLPARQPGSALEEARARLHVSSVPESLPCREQEFQDIYNFVESKVMDGTGGCMYISGVPGTGKTATVHEVIRSLQRASDADDIPAFNFIEINGMKMTDPHQAYVQILQKLTGQKATPDHAAALLEKRFSHAGPKKESTVLLVDELDLLWTRKQNVMYNLFDWPTRRHGRLVVLTIANTMDLPERIMINRVASRLGLTRMSFQPYSFKQLQQIIMSRLNKVKAFEEDALQLVSRKVAALSGDARRCLDICRRATEICEHTSLDPGAPGLVGMSHVMQALDEMFSSAYVTAIRCASIQEQLFLRSVLMEFRRLGLEEATFQQVLVQHQALCRVEGLQPPSVSEALAACQRLGACRLLLLEPSRLGVLQRVRLNVSQDDVLYALKAE
ncbi:origin recognition complex subunit 1 isoform X1 [Gadus macrocephalus]|uniref:origin recognition complex subunit 1 isoform X1 n=1 Tax=Gadus macrocephalus TaxID=80720 RepID=UPI0028CB8AD1|nr:origin recognition complex subunit 1 isoform X1 [Gadus macrocephalus]